MKINSHFDSGNIECISLSGSGDGIKKAQLRIRKDAQSDFYQWFYFRVTEGLGQRCQLNIENAGGAAYPGGWENYQAVGSYDQENWFRLPTSYANGELGIDVTPEYGSLYVAYFAPYDLQRHAKLISRCLQSPRASLEVLGNTVDGREIELLRIGDGDKTKKPLWAIARQHPGEAMAEWWMEGFLKRLLDESDASASTLLSKANLYVVPNMNPDGSFRGHLRTNAVGANLNREWQEPSLERSPEVFHVRARMQETGVDCCLDVHGDEALPYNFIAGTEGVVGWNDKKDAVLNQFKDNLARINPDFQTAHGYPRNQAGKANLSICSNNIAHSFQCLAMTLEMPFKDAADTPNPVTGWSPERAAILGASCVQALLDIEPQLADFNS